MAKLTPQARLKITKKNVAVPSKFSTKKGAKVGSYPIPDINHARNALARSAGKPVEAQVRNAVYRKFPELRKKMGMR